jgi:hypothetical protein
VFLLAVEQVFTVAAGVLLIAFALLVNNSVCYSQLGRANGLFVTVSSLAKAFAPVLSGALFGWSTNNGLMFPLNYFLVFVLAGLAILGTIVYFRVTVSSDDK